MAKILECLWHPDQDQIEQDDKFNEVSTNHVAAYGWREESGDVSNRFIIYQHLTWLLSLLGRHRLYWNLGWAHAVGALKNASQAVDFVSMHRTRCFDQYVGKSLSTGLLLEVGDFAWQIIPFIVSVYGVKPNPPGLLFTLDNEHGVLQLPPEKIHFSDLWLIGPLFFLVKQNEIEPFVCAIPQRLCVDICTSGVAPDWNSGLQDKTWKTLILKSENMTFGGACL